jgi:threonine synthase
MDVGDPSNFARLAVMYESSATRMGGEIAGVRVSEAETREAIRSAYRRSGTILDPHAAVAYSAAVRFQQETGTGAPIVVLATAHPAKFADAIRDEIGIEPALPEADRDWRSRPLLAVDLPDASPAAFSSLLRGLSPASR